MQRQLKNIKKEFEALTRCIKTRIEYEKSFGINSFESSSYSTEKERSNNLQIKQENVMAENLITLRENVLRCELCTLSQTRNNVVFGEGNPNADLMFVGEAPGYHEDVKGSPFVGRAGELLTKIINAIDLKRDEVYIANVLKCRPPENRNPNANEIILCYPYLERQIDLIKPKIICALGTFAIQTLLKSSRSISELRGIFHDYHGIKLIATFHPAYLLRNPKEKIKTWEDMKKVRDFLKEIRIQESGVRISE